MKPEFFSLFDISIGLGWLILILVGLWVIRLRNLDQEHYKYFYPALLFKLGFGLLFAFTYTTILAEGGDTLAYWEGAVDLNHLFWDNPASYFAEMMQRPSADTITVNFNQRTGYPPSWIYKEPESFFISKIISLFTFFTFNSYMALTLICSTIAGLCSWKLYELVKDFSFCKHWVLLAATLFIPTVAFWCSGISKDTFILAAFNLLIFYTFSILKKGKTLSLSGIIMIFLSAFVLFKIRDFMLIAIAAPLAFVLFIRIAKKLSNSPVLLWSTRILSTLVLMVVVLAYLQTTNESSNLANVYLEEVAVIQQDFKQNKLYTGYRYDLGITEYTPWGMIKAAPMSIITAFYRPFIWEANSAFLFVSGLEGLLLIALTIGFFFRSGNIWKHFAFIRTQEFLVFAILFSLLLGFFVGFTSGLFNVLVRFKAPFMAMIIIFFAARQPKKVENEAINGSDTCLDYPMRR